MGNSDSKKTGKLGTQLRGKLGDAYGHRGHKKSNIYYAYSPRTNRDWVLGDNLHWDHFVLCEADPTISSVDYQPHPISVRDSESNLISVNLAAVITLVDGTVIWRYLSTQKRDAKSLVGARDLLLSAAKNEGASLQCWSREDIDSKLQTRANWTRILAWMASARNFSLSSFSVGIAALIDARKSATLQDVLLLGNRESSPLYAAAAFRGIQRGIYISDLDMKVLSLKTIIASQDA